MSGESESAFVGGDRRVKVYILSYCPPYPSWGGAMTFFRHFIERSDFDVLVATNQDGFDSAVAGYEAVHFSVPNWWGRINRTRLLPWLNGLEGIYGGSLVPSSVCRRAVEFKPDAIFTVAGSWNWTALAAQRLARQLGVPLIASFNDWYDYGWFPVHRRMRPFIEARFRQFYREADLALCTSEGMREALGPHKNSHVWYPTGAPMSSDDGYQATLPENERPFTVFFGGSLGDWYGPMMEEIVKHCDEFMPSIRFKIFGSSATWSPEFHRWASEHGIFLGSVPFDELRAHASSADLLILPMGFGDECAQVERTSFKTKFLDYLSFRRPILVWGPEYCSAVGVAREFDSAECVTDPSAAVCGESISRLAADPQRRRQLIGNAMRMYQDRFHPDRIHSGLVEEIGKTVAEYQASQ